MKDYKSTIALLWFLVNCCFLSLINFKVAYYIYQDIEPKGALQVVTTLVVVIIPLLALTLTISLFLLLKFVMWIDRWVQK
jgi:uncharacterized membrane protein